MNKPISEMRGYNHDPCGLRTAKRMWQLRDRKIEGVAFYTSTERHYSDQIPVAVLPCHTAAQARALVRWHNRSLGDQVERLAKEMCSEVRASWADLRPQFLRMARACIAAMEGKQ